VFFNNITTTYYTSIESRGRSFVNHNSMDEWMMHCSCVRYDARCTDVVERFKEIHVRNLTWEQTEKQPEWRSCCWDYTSDCNALNSWVKTRMLDVCDIS